MKQDYTVAGAVNRLKLNGVKVEVKTTKIILKRPVGLRLIGAVDFLKGKGYTVV